MKKSLSLLLFLFVICSCALAQRLVEVKVMSNGKIPVGSSISIQPISDLTDKWEISELKTMLEEASKEAGYQCVEYSKANYHIYFNYGSKSFENVTADYVFLRGYSKKGDTIYELNLACKRFSATPVDWFPYFVSAAIEEKALYAPTGGTIYWSSMTPMGYELGIEKKILKKVRNYIK